MQPVHRQKLSPEHMGANSLVHQCNFGAFIFLLLATGDICLQIPHMAECVFDSPHLLNAESNRTWIMFAFIQ